MCPQSTQPSDPSRRDEPSADRSVLTVAVGDIHGRFHRVQEWLRTLEERLGREVDRVFAVGDVEAFASADDMRRKATKRGMPAEFAEYASGAASFHRPLHFIGGNNEDFDSLHGVPEGAELSPGFHYLGRVGVRTFGPLRVAYLSGIHAPRFYEAPLEVPDNRDRRKQAGYFRKYEVEALLREPPEADLLLVHEWPRGLLGRRKGEPAKATERALRAHRTPWAGNPITRDLVKHLRPRWVWAGHTHAPYAATLGHSDGSVTRVACLDQAAKPEGAILWMVWEEGVPTKAGWGLDGSVAWRAGEPWTEACVPES